MQCLFIINEHTNTESGGHTICLKRKYKYCMCIAKFIFEFLANQRNLYHDTRPKERKELQKMLKIN